MQQFLLLLFAATAVYSNCYDGTISGLTPVSQLSGGLGGVLTVPTGSHYLLDVEQMDIQGIVVESNASLFFDWRTDISISVGYIVVMGEFHIGSETCHYDKTATIQMKDLGDLNDYGFNMGHSAFVIMSGGTVELHGQKGYKNSWRLLNATAEAQQTTINAVDIYSQNNSTPWAAGDQIVIASTDYNPYQAEQKTILSINNTVAQLDTPLNYSHFGKVLAGVDMRGEVILLSRSITFIAPSSGAHMMMMQGFTAAHIEGVRFEGFGSDVIGRYPVHFHLCGQVPEGTYVRYNAIVHSTFRCLTIHATQGVLVQENVAYDSAGHCFFTEDGVEVGNQFVRNVVVLNKPKITGQHLGSDSIDGVSGFWITNANNTMIENRVAGCDGTGYWLHTRLGRRGLACNFDQYKDVRPANTPMAGFRGNTVHGCSDGFIIESKFFDDGDVPPQTQCDGSTVANFSPYYPNGTAAVSVLERYNAYKLRNRATWLKLAWVDIVDGTFSDNVEDFQFGTSGDHPFPALANIVRATAIGLSSNLGNNDGAGQFSRWDSTLNKSFPNGGPIIAWRMYDGPQVMRDSTFINFTSSAVTGTNSAFGVRAYNIFQMATTSAVINCTFLNTTNRLYFADVTADGGKTSNVRDDGSLSGYMNATIVPVSQFYWTSQCSRDSAYGMVAPHKYVNIWVLDMDHTSDAPANNLLTVTRNNHEDASHQNYSVTLEGFFSASKWRWQPVMSLNASYLLSFQSGVSGNLLLQLNNAEKDEKLRIAVCYPMATTIQGVYSGYAGFSAVLDGATQLNSVASMDQLTNGTYFWDDARKIMFLELQQVYTRTTYGDFCPNNGCNFVWIKATPQGDMGDCYARAYGSNSIQLTSGDWLSKRLISTNN